VTKPLRAATRGSALARWQTNHVASLLGVDVEVVVVQTEGDLRTDVPLDQLGGRGVFVKEVQAAVLAGDADFAVHSAKDLPASPELQPEGLVIAAIPERADARDALVGSRLEDLPAGALVATGSVRRRAQLANLRPDLLFTDLRGNIDTRLKKAANYDAIVMAYAALLRLDRAGEATEVLDPSVMLPQVAQGALAVECRADDVEVRRALAAIEHRQSRVAVDTERAFLAELGGGCDVPVGAYATVADDGEITIEGLIATRDGHRVVRSTQTGVDPQTAGIALAVYLLEQCGAASFFTP
jgi:hydroxymethylbilane synthase